MFKKFFNWLRTPSELANYHLIIVIVVLALNAYMTYDAKQETLEAKSSAVEFKSKQYIDSKELYSCQKDKQQCQRDYKKCFLENY